MSKLASQALVLSFARVANYALVFLSPLILVRLMAVEDFGRYREFLVYATVLVSFAGFSVTDSLLTFIPRYPASTAGVIGYTTRLVLLSSSIVVAVAVLLDVLSGGALFAGFVWPLAIYILLFVNVDFWEWYWLASKRPVPVFVYSAARLLARMIVVVTAAAVSRNVEVIVWSLVGLEAVRLAGASWFWRRLSHVSETPLPSGFRSEQLGFCIPWGLAIMVGIASRNLGNIAVVKVLGAAHLAQYVIGLYGEPVITTMRNSISSVLLPEMVRRETTDPDQSIGLWRHAVVINCIVMFPIAIVCLRYADVLVNTAFGPAYAPAALVLQLFMLVVVRECFDLTLPFRARGKSVSFVRSGLTGLAVNAILLFLLVPRVGIVGAVLALIGGSVCEAIYLAGSLRQFLSTTYAELLPWRAIGCTVLAAIAALCVLWSDRLLPLPAPAGAIVTIVAAALIYFMILRVTKVPEMAMLLEWGRRLAQRTRKPKALH